MVKLLCFNIIIKNLIIIFNKFILNEKDFIKILIKKLILDLYYCFKYSLYLDKEIFVSFWK